MRRPLLALALFVTTSSCASDQAGNVSMPFAARDGTVVAPPDGRIGVIIGPARRKLIADWDAQVPGDLGQTERAYCVTNYATLRVAGNEGDTLLVQIVAEIEAAPVQYATRWSVRFACPTDETGRSMPTIHSHPATICRPSTGLCMADSSQMTPRTCGPSALDVEGVTRARLAFAVVVCGRGVWTFYAPLTHAPVVVQAGSPRDSLPAPRPVGVPPTR